MSQNEKKSVDKRPPPSRGGGVRGDMTPPSVMLSAVQRNGGTLTAGDIYRDTWQWLQDRGCAEYVPPQLLERYAMSAARWAQCEEAISTFGLIAKDSGSGRLVPSPYVVMGQEYMRTVNRLWDEIYQAIKDRCEAECSAPTPRTEAMLRLARSRSGAAGSTDDKGN